MLIVTSVVPRHLPMQTALAVNTALMALMKAGVMCTEPFRVPTAGKIDAVLFDKTGTLTTDKLVPVGIVNASAPTAAAGGARGVMAGGGRVGVGRPPPSSPAATRSSPSTASPSCWGTPSRRPR